MNTAFEETPGDCTQNASSFCDVSIFLPAEYKLESGERLSRPEMRIRIYGELDKPVIVAAGGVSAGRVVADINDERGWWREIVGADGFVDLEKYCVIGFDFLPNAGEKARTISTADQARALASALDVLKIDAIYAFIGASYGGMTALSFAESYPERVEKLCVISAGARPHPAATALRGVQRRIIEFAIRAGEGREGVALARQLAMISYRTPEEFEERFEYSPGEMAGDPHDVCAYLISRGAAYGMNADRYVTLSDSVDRHDADASRIIAKCLFIAATSDRLVPLSDMRHLAEATKDSKLIEIESLFGHDAFLKETAAIGPHIQSFLEERSL